MISVQTIDDNAFEGSETFSVTLSNPVGAVIGDGVGTGTILDNDQAPVVIIANTARLEGQRGLGRDRPADVGSRREPHRSSNANGMPNAARSSAPVLPDLARDDAGRSDGDGRNYRGPFTYSGKNGNTLLNVRPAGSALGGQIAFRPSPMSFTVLLCNAAQSGTDADHCVSDDERSSTTTVAVHDRERQSATAFRTIPVKSGQDYVAACSVKNAHRRSLLRAGAARRSRFPPERPRRPSPSR